MASANLIRLHREENILRILQRFSGWATSVPGGGGDVDKREVKKTIAKGFHQLPFEERRLSIDQGHKLIAAVNQTIAEQAGAIAVRWRHVHQAGYNGRPEHEKRDNEIYALKGNWAIKAGLMKKGHNPYYSDTEQAAEAPYCFPGDSKLQFANGVRKAYKRFYSGDVITLETESSRKLRATPKHPVLTPNGWVAIGSLKEGDYIIEMVDKSVKLPRGKLNANNRVPTIGEAFETLSQVGTADKVSGSSKQFHGDGIEGNVNVVNVARSLSFGIPSTPFQRFKNFNFPHSNLATSCLNSLKLFLQRAAFHSTGLVCSSHASNMLFWRFVFCYENIRFTLFPGLYSIAAQPGIYGSSIHHERFSQRKNRFPRFETPYNFIRVNIKSGVMNLLSYIKPLGLRSSMERFGFYSPEVRDLTNRFPFRTKAVKLRTVNRDNWSGHVYNLETKDGWYATEGIIAHNCRCWVVAIYSLNDLPDDMLTREGNRNASQTA